MLLGKEKDDQKQHALPYIPSSQSYISLLNTLRGRKMVNQMKIILHSLSNACNAWNQHHNISATSENIDEKAERNIISPAKVHIIAINTYIAALCDAALFNGQNNQNEDDTDNLNDYLDEAVSHVLVSSTAAGNDVDQRYPYLSIHTKPDLHSYNTILHTAAKLQNVTVFDKVYSLLIHEASIHPDIYTYNARLKLCMNEDVDESEKNARALEIINELQSNPNVSPDQYTIDLALIPLVKGGHVGQVLSLLDDYVFLTNTFSPNLRNATTYPLAKKERRNWDQMSNAFASFLNTLVKANEIEMAQTTFDTFLLPSSLSSTSSLDGNGDGNEISKVTTMSVDVGKFGNSPSSSLVTVQPSVRHFNTLIDGYKRLVSNQKIRRIDHDADLLKKESKEKQQMKNDSSFFNPNPSSPSSLGRTKIVSNAKRQAMNLFLAMLHLRIRPDAYTISSIMGLLTTPDEISTVYRVARRFVLRDDLNFIVYRSIMTAYGKIEDPSSAAWLLDEMEERYLITRKKNIWKGTKERLESWNVLLTTLSKGNAFHSNKTLNLSGCNIVMSLQKNDPLNNMMNISDDEKEEKDEGKAKSLGQIGTLLDGKTCAEAAAILLELMTMDSEEFESRANEGTLLLSTPPRPNTQTFTLVASTYSHDDNFIRNIESGKSIAMQLYRNATSLGIPADGRFVNAIIRCFGDDIAGAIKAWKDELGRAVRTHENRPRQQQRKRKKMDPRKRGKNLLACYHGLMHVCGRAGKPDIALRIVYAMNKEGIEPTENALKCYESGKRALEGLMERSEECNEQGENGPLGAITKPKIPRMANQFESLLAVECTKYDVEDKRRLGDKRVRIIF